MKRKFTYKEYISILSMLADASFKSAEEAFYNYRIDVDKSILNGIKLSLIYLVADLSYYWLNLNKDTVQKDLLNQFYKEPPEKFYLYLNASIKSHDTQIGDICNFLTEIYSPKDAIARLDTLHFISSELTPALNCFAAMFRATKRKGEYFHINFVKYAFLAKRKS